MCSTTALTSVVEPTPDGSPQFFNIRVYREHFGARIHSAFAVRALTAALPVLAPGLALLAAVGVLVPHFDETILFGVVCAVAAGFAVWFGMILATLLLVRRWLNTTTEVLQLIPEFLVQVSKDVSALEGGAQVPAHEAADLAVRAYDSVLLPLVVEAIETQYGLLGRIACGAYRRFVSPLMRRAVGKAVTESSGEGRREFAVQRLSDGANVALWLEKNFGRFARPAKSAATALSVVGLIFAGFVAFLLPTMTLLIFG